MRIPRLFVDQALQIGQQLELPGDRAHYAVNVLRLTAGRPLILFNGEGGEYRGSLLNASRKSATVELEAFDPADRESPLDVELAVGISRGDKMDWIIQKATELGVRRISPLYTERTEVKLKSDRLAKRTEHWRQVLISACEQCQRNRLPVLNAPRDLADFLGSCDSDARMILHPASDTAPLTAAQRPSSASMLIGPEGGFSDTEVAQATKTGFVEWQLGERILRTETAPLAALSILQFHWGDLG